MVSIKCEPDAENGGVENSNVDWNANYSEGICIEEEGPARKVAFTSHVEYSAAARNYKECVLMEQKMVPYLYRSTLVVKDDGQEDAGMKYFEEIRFKPKWGARRFEETVYNYPKEAVKRYVSTLTYDRNSKSRTFVSGLNICANVNNVDLGQWIVTADIEVKAEESAKVSSKTASANFKQELMENGTVNGTSLLMC